MTSSGTFGGSHATPRPKPSAVRDIGIFLVLPILIAVVMPLTMAWGYRVYMTWPADHQPPPHYKSFTGRLGE